MAETTSPVGIESGFRVEVDDGVATVTLSRPDKRNAQTPQMWRDLVTAAQALPETVRVLVLRADGPSFSAGLDRRMFTLEGIPGEPTFLALAGLPEAELDEVIAGFQGAFTWLRESPFVTVAVVQGHAVGAGFQLALACDLRLVADDVQLAMREPSLGLVPDLGGTKPLVELVGYARALEICATGRWVGADEAVRTGLATAAVPLAELDDALADLLAALLAPPAGAVRETKALLRDAADRTYGEQLAAERAAQRHRLVDLARAATEG